MAGVEWTDTGTSADGALYTNSGAHILRLCWGTLVSFHAYLRDGAAVGDALARLVTVGMPEAAAPSITTIPTGSSTGPRPRPAIAQTPPA